MDDTLTTTTDSKKLDTKKIRKFYNFMVYTLCHYSLNIYSTISLLGPVNYPVLIELLNNCIFNVFTLCLSNNINLDKTKSLIDETCLLVTDYITICRDDEFKDKTDKLRIANAIAYGYQKINDKIIANIPTITKHSNFIDSLDMQNGAIYSQQTLPDKPSSLPKSFGRPNNRWSSINIPPDDTDNTVIPVTNMVRNKFSDLSTTHGNKPILCVRGVNFSKTNKVIYLMCAFVTRIFSTMIKISFAESNKSNSGFIQFMPFGTLGQSVLAANIEILETYVNCMYPVIYTTVKNNIYMDLAMVENDLALVTVKAGRDWLVALYMYLRELCKMHAGIDRFLNHKVIVDISLFIKTQNVPFEHETGDNLKNKSIIGDIKWFDAIYKQFNNE